MSTTEQENEQSTSKAAASVTVAASVPSGVAAKSNMNAVQAHPSNASSSKKYVSNLPPPQKQEILEEDDYTAALSKIIERDFFPDLAKLKRQHAYLEAVEMGDLDRIRNTALELAGKDTPFAQRRLQTPARTPKYAAATVPNQEWTPARVDVGKATPSWDDSQLGRGGKKRTGKLADLSPSHSAILNDETPILDTPFGATSRTRRKRTSQSEQHTESGGKIDTSLSLDAFQARYTSEDNASFNEIIERANRERQTKYQWMYDRETTSMRVQVEGSNRETISTNGQKLLTQGENHGNSTQLITNGKRAKEHGLQGSDSEESNAGNGAEKLAAMLKDDRPSAAPTWEFKVKNTLMYFPEGLGTNLVEDNLVRGQPKKIIHRNTGFQDQDLLVVNQSAAAKIDATADRERADDGTPSVNGFKFVSSTPSPAMSQLGDDPELLTWGTIEDEPLLISSGIASSGPSHFKLPPTPRRELIAQKLTEKASKSFREKTNLRAQVFSSPSTATTPLAKYHQDHFGSSTSTPKFNSPHGVTSSSTPFRTPGMPASKMTSASRISSPNPRMRAGMLSPAAKRLLEKAGVGRSSKGSSLSKLNPGRAGHPSSSSSSFRGGSFGSADSQLRSHYNSPSIERRLP